MNMKSKTLTDEKKLRIVLKGRWTVGELAEFLRRLDELYSFAHVLHHGVRLGKDPEQIQNWLKRSHLYSLPELPDLPKQVQEEVRGLHSYFPPGKELRVLKLRLGSPQFFDLIGVAKLIESIGAGFRYIVTAGWRKDRALNEIEVRERLLKVASDDLKLMEDAGYPKERIQEILDDYYGLYRRIRPFVEGGKVIDVKVETETKALPPAKSAKKKRGAKRKRSGR